MNKYNGILLLLTKWICEFGIACLQMYLKINPKSYKIKGNSIKS